MMYKKIDDFNIKEFFMKDTCGSRKTWNSPYSCEPLAHQKLISTIYISLCHITTTKIINVQQSFLKDVEHNLLTKCL